MESKGLIKSKCHHRWYRFILIQYHEKKNQCLEHSDSVPILERRKLVKTYKNVLPRKQILVAEVSGETYWYFKKKKKKHKNGVEKQPQT